MGAWFVTPRRQNSRSRHPVAPFTVNPDSVSVVDGSICFEFAPTDDAAFFRFSVQYPHPAPIRVDLTRGSSVILAFRPFVFFPGVMRPFDGLTRREGSHNTSDEE